MYSIHKNISKPCIFVLARPTINAHPEYENFLQHFGVFKYLHFDLYFKIYFMELFDYIKLSLNILQ